MLLHIFIHMYQRVPMKIIRESRRARRHILLLLTWEQGHKKISPSCSFYVSNLTGPQGGQTLVRRYFGVSVRMFLEKMTMSSIDWVEQIVLPNVGSSRIHWRQNGPVKGTPPCDCWAGTLAFSCLWTWTEKLVLPGFWAWQLSDWTLLTFLVLRLLDLD